VNTLPSHSVASFEATIASGKSERAAGHIGRAVELFVRAATLATNADQRAEAYLSACGSQIRLFQYRAALDSADLVIKQALLAHNNTLAGAAYSNQATIYQLFGSNQLASDASSHAVSLLKDSPRKDYLAMALLNDGDIASKLGHQTRAREELQAAINTVRQSNLPSLEALAEDHLGLVLLDSRDLAGASNAYERAEGIQVSLHDYDDLAVTKQHLAELMYQQGNYRRALVYLNEADSSGGTNFSAIPSYWSPQLRAQILAGMGRRSEALVSFRRAVRAANHWRRYALPGDLTSIQTAATLHTVYRGFIDVAGEIAIERHDTVLAHEAFAVLAESRAAALQEQITGSLEHQIALPPRYFQLLQELQAAEAKLDLGIDEKHTVALTGSVQRTRNELADLENKAGIRRTDLPPPRYGHISATSIQQSLNSDELLLSFSLGEKRSFLWAVSRNQLELYRLPAESVVASHASPYFAAVHNNSVPAAERELLSHDLIGQLDPALAAKRQWLIVGDGLLLDRVPFAALPIPGKKGYSELLIAHHSLRFLPCEQQPLKRGSLLTPTGRFLGIADPIYNFADPRLTSRATVRQVSNAHPHLTLARLAGSAAEVRLASRASGISSVELLTGADASQAKLQAALAYSQPPSVLHFAVHVISTSAAHSPGPNDSALALSLTSSGIPELLTKEAIAHLRVPGALIVLSGCTSQAGEIVPSAGLIGLGRAWLLAGAAAVIVSAWPIPDDPGGFFSVFYSHLHADHYKHPALPERAAAALQETQVDMQHNGISPSLWAGYSLISTE
jgi:CHAT domain-containing protein/predicted negative regulator of RcsB-dependent stress response